MSKVLKRSHSAVVSHPQVRKIMSQVTTRSQAKEMDEKAAAGETVVPGGTGGHSVEAQERLAAGRKAGGEARKQQIITEGYSEMAKKGNHTKHDGGGSEGAK